MKLLFNHHKQGQAEIVKALGFLSSDFSYARLRTCIKLETPMLTDFIGKDVYNKLVAVYETLPELIIDEDEDAYFDASALNKEQKSLIEAIELAQVYIGTLAYSKYAPNNDLRHTTSGRKMDRTENEVTPWDWQIAKSDASLQKTAYTTLDRLILALEESEIKEWINSEARKKATSLFVYKTSIFNDKFPINNSAQLYYRCVPFMADVENLEIKTRLGAVLFDELKAINQDTTQWGQKTDILTLIHELVVYQTLLKAYRLLPIEMFPDKVSYNPKSRNNTEQMVRESVLINLSKEVQRKYLRLEQKVSDITKSTTSVIPQKKDHLQGLNANNKHVDL